MVNLMVVMVLKSIKKLHAVVVCQVPSETHGRPLDS